MESQRLQIAKAILRKDNKAGGITLPDFKFYLPMVTKQYGTSRQTDRHIDQQHRKPRNKPRYTQSIKKEPRT